MFESREEHYDGIESESLRGDESTDFSDKNTFKICIKGNKTFAKRDVHS